ncbi:peptidoglycan bridge formation glycyltransferase FemA/FemB family protein [Candidatus Daviesbacteria bacterium]|nr:peptidoglycan bridge formation glycyltransferase FemA/FemB family protein [Candidatus Daviesbacteria bacterium]
MDLRPMTNKTQYNKLVTHVIQSWEWGEFRKSLETPILRYGIFKNGKLSKVFQLTFHKIPLTNKYAGYLPKGPLPDKELAEALTRIGKENNCAFIKLEPDIEILNTEYSIPNTFMPSPKPLFTKYNFILDLTKSEEELLKNMHPKTRYNIKIAQKHGVKVEEKVDDQAFEIYLKLYFITTKRQGYHGHNEQYHRNVWKTLCQANMARLLIAFYNEHTTHNPSPLSAWMLLNFKDTLYYPYGGSSTKYKEVMANNLVCWEAIKLGKKMGLKKFDMWGALGPDAKSSDPWFGFHKFKQGYGGELVEYMGTYDLIFDWPLYIFFTIIDKITPFKVFLLKLLKK